VVALGWRTWVNGGHSHTIVSHLCKHTVREPSQALPQLAHPTATSVGVERAAQWKGLGRRAVGKQARQRAGAPPHAHPRTVLEAMYAACPGATAVLRAIMEEMKTKEAPLPARWLSPAASSSMGSSRRVALMQDTRFT
jgi:hypothetical protein